MGVLTPILPVYSAAMTDTQEITGNSKPITDGEPTLLDLRRQLDHMDERIHGIEQLLGAIHADTKHTAAFIVLHEPTLDRALKLFDNPVAKWRASKAAAAKGPCDGC
jgi:hypothetical protein